MTLIANEQDERQEVLAELLHRGGAVVEHPPAEREHHAGDHEERRPDQPVEDDERRRPSRAGNRTVGKPNTNARYVSRSPGHGLEVDPAPDERERDRGREQAAPHDQPVREPAQRPAPEDEAVGGELDDDAPHELARGCADECRGAKNACQPRRQYMRVGGRCSHIA